jgi:iron complex transport system permease protein
MRDIPVRRVLLPGLILLFFLHLAIGSYLWISPQELLEALAAGPGSDGVAHIVWELRLPRAIACASVGGSLAWVGAVFQMLFRNPIAEPFVLGVSSGAAIGAALVLVLGGSALLGGFAMPLAGFLTGTLALGLLFTLTGGSSQRSVADLLVSGAVLGSMLAALLSFILLYSGQDSNQVLRWLLGSLSEARWSHLAMLCLVSIAAFFVVAQETRSLNALAVGEEAASRLGVDLVRIRSVVLVACTVTVSVVVSVAGIIGFIGLVAPHIARRIAGTDLRQFIIPSALIGACLALASDVLAQRLMNGSEIPIGAITALIGSPFLWAVLRRAN